MGSLTKAVFTECYAIVNGFTFLSLSADKDLESTVDTFDLIWNGY